FDPGGGSLRLEPRQTGRSEIDERPASRVDFGQLVESTSEFSVSALLSTSGSSTQEDLTLAGVFRELGGPLELRAGFVEAKKLVEEVAEHAVKVWVRAE